MRVRILCEQTIEISDEQAAAVTFDYFIDPAELSAEEITRAIAGIVSDECDALGWRSQAAPQTTTIEIVEAITEATRAAWIASDAALFRAGIWPTPPMDDSGGEGGR